MNYSDRELLAKTIQAEAGNQGAQGMMAVGNVIMNRLKKGETLSDVILAPGQFSPWNSVTGYAGGAQGVDMSKVRPSEEAYKKADLLLSGNYEDITGGATHFYNPSISNPAWGRDKAGGDWLTIGSHIFGKAGGYRTGKGRTMEPTQQKRTGLGGLLGLMGQGDEDTGLTPFQRFAAALDPLIMPEMRGGAAIREMGKARAAKAQQNKTIDFLKSSGRQDLADLVANRVISIKDAAGLVVADRETMIKSGKLTATAEFIAQQYEKAGNQKAADFIRANPTASVIQNAQQNLLSGMIGGGEFRAATPEEAAKYGAEAGQFDKSGRFYPTQKVEKTQSLTEGQGKATGFYVRANDAQKILNRVEQEGAKMRSYIAGSLPFGNFLRTTDGQLYHQAKTQFITAVLRQDSGAVIGETEFANTEREFFPVPGDGPEIIEQKRKARESAILGLQIASGEGAEKAESTDTPKAPDKVYNPETGKFE